MKKGMILINVIIVMVMLNVVVFTIFMMNKNLVNSRALSIRNKESDIYISSKINIVDFSMKECFRNSLADFKLELEKDEKLQNSVIISIMDGEVRKNINIPDFSEEITIKKEASKIKFDSYIIDFDMSFFDEEEKTRKFFSYSIQLPKFTKEDREDIKSGDLDKIFLKYKSNLILKKIIY